MTQGVSMDSRPLLTRVVTATNTLVDGLSVDQLAAPSPCAGWTVRDVVNHITGGATMFAVSAEQGSVPDDVMGQIMGGDLLGDDPKGVWKAAADRALAAFDQPGILEKVVKLPFGEMPAGMALNIAVFDLATHAADIANATGANIADDELLEAALGMGRQFIGPDMRVAGMFDAEVTAPAGASAATRLLAFAGRKV